jgi:hypothetical protein
MQSKGHQTQAQKPGFMPLITLPKKPLTLFIVAPRSILLHFVLLILPFDLSRAKAPPSPSNAALKGRSSTSFILYAGSDSGGISSIRPRCSRRTRWQRRANDKLCVAMREVSWCSRCSRAIKAKTASAVCPSKSPVGSSASKSLGPVMSARAKATRCCSPPESSPER